MGYTRRDVGPLKSPKGSNNFQSKSYIAYRETDERTMQLFSLKDILFAILFLVLIVGGTIFLKSVYGFEMTVFDPIADVKESVKTIESVYAFVTFVFFVLACCWCYDPSKVHKCVVLALLFSVLMTTSLFVAKTYLDTTYTTSAFLEMYQNPEYKEFIGRVSAEEFVGASMEGFENFSLRNKINIYINLFVIALEIYFFTRTNKIMEKQEKIRMYDEALFDDEINVKI